MRKDVEIIVYGEEQICASCVGMPSSIETYEWLAAALERKFPGQPFSIQYVDFNQPPSGDRHQEFVQKLLEDELFYPLVVMDGEIIAEGNPRLKTITERMELQGYRKQPEKAGTE